jgi:hypothetical protein
MRRLASTLALVALGAFLLTSAVMLRAYAAPRAALLPARPALTITLTGTGTAYDLAAGAPVAGPLTEEYLVRGAGPAGAVVIWDVSRRLSRRGVLLRLADERVALNRRTALAATCCGEHPPHQGRSYAFPPDLPATDQVLYDPATGVTVTARYVGIDPVGGVPAYRLEQQVPPTDLGERTLPGAPPTRSGRVLAETRRTLWIDPASGLPLRIEERLRERFRPAGGAELTLLDVTLATDPASERRLAGLAAQRRRDLRLLGRTGPLALAGAGLLVLVAGAGYRIVTSTLEMPGQGSTFVVTRW